MKKIYILLASLIVPTISLTFFSNLPEISQYAASIDEYPPIQGTTWANPDFSAYSRTLVQGWFNRFLYNMNLKTPPSWNIRGFAHLLSEVTNDRENSGYIGRYVIKMKPQEGSTFIIWGDVQGAFHSLVRALEELFKRGIIDENLQIIKPDYYFIFNGDFINRSAYSLEALGLVLKLMNTNPDKIFYIRGNHEDVDHWKNFNLKNDLIIRAASISNEDPPLGKEISSFFNTLPLALYLIGNEDNESINVIRISHYGRDKTELDEETFTGFFEGTNKTIQLFQLNNKIKDSEKKINIRAIVKSESRSTIYRPTPGLAQLESDKGSTAWTLLSAPTESYRHLQDFYFDAFAFLNVGKTLNEWTITLYNQDVRELLGFKKNNTYNLITGLQELRPNEESTSNDQLFTNLLRNKIEIEEKIKNLSQSCNLTQKNKETIEVNEKKETLTSEPKAETTTVEAEPPTEMVVQDNVIVIGTSIPLERFAKMYGTNIQNGLMMPITNVNNRGGVHNKSIKLITLDDEYTPDNTRKNILTLLNEYKTNILLSPFGDPTLEAYQDLIKEEKVLVLFPNSGVGRGLKYVVHLRSSYAQQGKILVDYAIKNKEAKRIAILYQNDIWAKNAIEGAKEAFKKHNITDYLFVSSERYVLDLSEQAKKIKEFNPDAIGFYVLSIPTKELLNKVGMDFLTKKMLFGLDTLSEPRLGDFLKQKGLDMIISNIVPNPNASNIDIVKEYRKDAAEKGLEFNTISLEAYINSSVFIDCLKRLEKPINKDNLLEFIENIKNYEFNGLKLNFYDRGLLNTLWLNTGKPEWEEIDLLSYN
jgi:ABC-type branched-subunit amino acid transport system substrate-binding protein